MLKTNIWIYLDGLVFTSLSLSEWSDAFRSQSLIDTKCTSAFFFNWFVLSNVWLNRFSLTNLRNQQKQADQCHTNLIFSLVTMESIHSFPVPRAGVTWRDVQEDWKGMAMAEGWTAAPGRRRRTESLSALPRVSSGLWEREQQQLVITTVSATCPPYSHFHYLHLPGYAGEGIIPLSPRLFFHFPVW